MGGRAAGKVFSLWVVSDRVLFAPAGFAAKRIRAQVDLSLPPPMRRACLSACCPLLRPRSICGDHCESCIVFSDASWRSRSASPDNDRQSYLVGLLARPQ